MKKLISFILLFAVILSFSASSYAYTCIDQNPGGGSIGTNAILVPQTTKYWTYTTKPAGSATAGNWILLYEGYPASASGEIDTVSAGVSYSHTYSGSFALNYKSVIQTEFGITFGREAQFSISRESRSLKKGEYIKAYYKKNYKLTTVNQTEYKKVEGWEQSYPGGPYRYINQTTATGNTKTATVKEAILPQVKLEYYPKTHSSQTRGIGDAINVQTAPCKVEIYEFINGNYVLVNSEVAEK